MKPTDYTKSIVILTLLLQTGCSISSMLVGQVHPVDEKSQNVQMVALETMDPNWKRIDSTSESSNDSPDRAWQSVKTASVISLNSVCRGNTSRTLKEITADLLLQWRNLKNVHEKEIALSGHPALETTAEGVYFDRKRSFQTVIVKTPSCVFDLIFLSPTKSFSQDLAVFQAFRDKLIFK
jgi:hypothetical protein